LARRPRWLSRCWRWAWRAALREPASGSRRRSLSAASRPASWSGASPARTVVTNISTPSPDCRWQFGIFGEPGTRLQRLRVDGRGRFRGIRRAQTDGIAAVEDRFIGRRPRIAWLRARWRSGPCQSTARFRLRPAGRVAVQDGSWTGSHRGDGAIRFEVVNTGREVTDFAFAWSPEFRCADGSTHRYPSYPGGSELAWIRRDGSFSLRQAQDDMLLTMQGILSGGAGSGSFRIIETHLAARGVCDTGPVAFTARRSP
jgi:hypothetical protein